MSSQASILSSSRSLGRSSLLSLRACPWSPLFWWDGWEFLRGSSCILRRLLAKMLHYSIFPCSWTLWWCRAFPLTSPMPSFLLGSQQEARLRRSEAPLLSFLRDQIDRPKAQIWGRTCQGSMKAEPAQKCQYILLDHPWSSKSQRWAPSGLPNSEDTAATPCPLTWQ